MQVSKSKRKQIIRLAKGKDSPRQIAKALDLDEKTVLAVLKEEAKEAGVSSAELINADSQTVSANIILAVTLAAIGISSLVIYQRLHNISYLPQACWIQMTMAICSLAAIGHWALFARNKFSISFVHIPVFLFIGWAGIGYFWSHNKWEYWETISQWLACTAAFCLIYSLCKNGRALRNVLIVLAASGFLVAFIGVMQYFQVDLIKGIPQVSPPSATFANKNFAVHIVVPSTALLVGFFLYCPMQYLALPAVGATLNTLYLFYTGTRSGWLAGIMMTLVFFIALIIRAGSSFKECLKPGSDLFWRLAIFVVCFFWLIIGIHLTPKGFQNTLFEQYNRVMSEVAKFVPSDSNLDPDVSTDTETSSVMTEDTDTANTDSPVAPTIVQHKGPTIEESLASDAPHFITKSGKKAVKAKVSKEASFAGRIKVWRNSLFMVKDFPLIGTGPGNFKIYFPIYDGLNDGEPMFDDRIQLSNTHNDYVQIWCETGTIGLILLFGMIGALGYALWKIRPVGADHWLRIAILAACAGMALNAFFSMPVQKAVPPLFMMSLLAVAARWYTLSTKREINFSIPSAIPYALLIPAIAMVVLSGFYQYNRLRGNNRYAYVVFSVQSKNWQQALKYADEASRYTPKYGKLHAYYSKGNIELANTPDMRARELSSQIKSIKNQLARLPGGHPQRKELSNQTARLETDMKALLNGAREHYEKALSYSEQALVYYPNSPNAMFDRGIAYARLCVVEKMAGNDDKAKELADNALDIYLQLNELLPNYPRLHNNLASVYVELGKTSEALKEFRLECLLFPDIPEVWFNYGSATLQTITGLEGEKRLARCEVARQALEQALKRRPDWDAANQMMGVILFQHLDRKAEGIRYLKKAVELNPNVRDATTIRGVIKKWEAEQSRSHTKP